MAHLRSACARSSSVGRSLSVSWAIVMGRYMPPTKCLRPCVRPRGASRPCGLSWTVGIASMRPSSHRSIGCGANAGALTDDDRVACLVVDKILGSKKWWSDPDEDDKPSAQSWSEIVSKTRLHMVTERAVADFYRRRSQAVDGG